MQAVSNTKNALYETDKMVFFKNTEQSAFYVYHGAELVDIDCEISNGRYQMIFVFTKDDHNRLKFKWKKNKENLKQG